MTPARGFHDAVVPRDGPDDRFERRLSSRAWRARYGPWPLVVTFWVFTLLFGLGVALFSGWSFMLLVAWVLLATVTMSAVRQAREANVRRS